MSIHFWDLSRNLLVFGGSITNVIQPFNEFDIQCIYTLVINKIKIMPKRVGSAIYNREDLTNAIDAMNMTARTM